jgi:F-type H+-transporting ATPase subunit b
LKRRIDSFSKSPVKILLLALVIGICSPGVVVAHAQAAPSATAESARQNASPQQESKQANAEQKTEANSVDKYRLSPAVQWIARSLNIRVETAATIFEDLNFAILAASILYFLIKFLPKIFSSRKAALAKQLLDARSATDQANERLSGVEARLSRIDEDIAAIRRQVEQDAAQDEVRIKAALQEETRRIAEAAGQEVEAAGAAVQRELRKFAAELAIDRATSRLSLTPEIDRRLVSNFSKEIVGEPTNAAISSVGDPFRGERN